MMLGRVVGGENSVPARRTIAVGSKSLAKEEWARIGNRSAFLYFHALTGK